MTRPPVVLRAEITKRIGPGTAYLLTRVYLADGTILEQTNRGLPDVENGWITTGREPDRAGVGTRLVREGWLVSAPP